MNLDLAASSDNGQAESGATCMACSARFRSALHCTAAFWPNLGKCRPVVAPGMSDVADGIYSRGIGTRISFNTIAVPIYSQKSGNKLYCLI